VSHPHTGVDNSPRPTAKTEPAPPSFPFNDQDFLTLLLHHPGLAQAMLDVRSSQPTLASALYIQKRLIDPDTSAEVLTLVLKVLRRYGPNDLAAVIREAADSESGWEMTLELVPAGLAVFAVTSAIEKLGSGESSESDQDSIRRLLPGVTESGFQPIIDWGEKRMFRHLVAATLAHPTLLTASPVSLGNSCTWLFLSSDGISFDWSFAESRNGKALLDRLIEMRVELVAERLVGLLRQPVAEREEAALQASAGLYKIIGPEVFPPLSDREFIEHVRSGVLDCVKGADFIEFLEPMIVHLLNSISELPEPSRNERMGSDPAVTRALYATYAWQLLDDDRLREIVDRCSSGVQDALLIGNRHTDEDRLKLSAILQDVAPQMLQDARLLDAIRTARLRLLDRVAQNDVLAEALLKATTGTALPYSIEEVAHYIRRGGSSVEIFCNPGASALLVLLLDENNWPGEEKDPLGAYALYRASDPNAAFIERFGPLIREYLGKPVDNPVRFLRLAACLREHDRGIWGDDDDLRAKVLSVRVTFFASRSSALLHDITALANSDLPPFNEREVDQLILLRVFERFKLQLIIAVLSLSPRVDFLGQCSTHITAALEKILTLQDRLFSSGLESLQDSQWLLYKLRKESLALSVSPDLVVAVLTNPDVLSRITMGSAETLARLITATSGFSQDFERRLMAGYITVLEAAPSASANVLPGILCLVARSKERHLHRSALLAAAQQPWWTQLPPIFTETMTAFQQAWDKGKLMTLSSPSNPSSVWLLARAKIG
jgi:hypothetical protein